MQHVKPRCVTHVSSRRNVDYFLGEWMVTDPSLAGWQAKRLATWWGSWCEGVRGRGLTDRRRRLGARRGARRDHLRATIISRSQYPASPTDPTARAPRVSRLDQRLIGISDFVGDGRLPSRPTLPRPPHPPARTLPRSVRGPLSCPTSLHRPSVALTSDGLQDTAGGHSSRLMRMSLSSTGPGSGRSTGPMSGQHSVSRTARAGDGGNAQSNVRPARADGEVVMVT